MHSSEFSEIREVLLNSFVAKWIGKRLGDNQEVSDLHNFNFFTIGIIFEAIFSLQIFANIS